MALSVGSRLGPYEVLGAIGAGGMGEVYRAHDTKLNRDVALKVLPEFFAADPERLARFRREAQVLAALNHTNIGHIYGLEESGDACALVLELVEGPTLAEVIEGARRSALGAREGLTPRSRIQPESSGRSLAPSAQPLAPARVGSLPLADALPIAAQIAEALEAAHEAGIIHRDLKPSNVKVRPDGTVKVLDFGLAKLGADAVGEGSGAAGLAATASPTLTSPAAATRLGMIIGTAAYMSPEQARGRVADRRSDVWAFGCVLYEMLTGVRPFEGEDVSDTLASVLRSDPKWELLASTPPVVSRLVRRCLEKDPRKRFQHVGDLRLEVQEMLQAPLDSGLIAPAAPSQPSAAPPRLHPAVALGLTSTASVLVTALALWGVLGDSVPPAADVARLALVTDAPVFPQGIPLALSPDGKTLFYVGRTNVGSLRQIYRRPLDQLETVALPGTEEAGQAFVSPDGQWLGFIDTRERTLRKMPADGGPAVTLCKLPDGMRGASWSTDGTIVFGKPGAGLMRVSAAGGEPQPLTTVDQASGQSHINPQVLPDGESVLFEIGGLSILASGVAVYSPDLGEVRRLLDGSRPHYVASGHVVFVRNPNTLWAAPFDLDKLTVTGEPFPVLEGIRINNSGLLEFTVSGTGTLVYAQQSTAAMASSLVWVDRDGKEGAALAEGVNGALYPRFSPDGTKLALVAGTDPGRSVWVYDLRGRPPIRATFSGMPYTVVWTPDGRRLAFEYDSDPATPEVPIHAAAPDGSGTDAPEPVTTKGHHHPIAFTPDGGELIFAAAQPGSGWDLMAQPIGGGEPRVVLRTEYSEGIEGASLTRDGRWLAYVSDATGQSEIWVRPLEGGAAIRISPNGGVEPVWSRDGRDLFYREGDRMMAVAVSTDGEFAFDAPKLLFERRYAGRNDQPPSYDVAADGRFIMIKSAATEMAPREELIVVLGWLEELKRRAPAR